MSCRGCGHPAHAGTCGEVEWALAPTCGCTEHTDVATPSDLPIANVFDLIPILRLGGGHTGATVRLDAEACRWLATELKAKQGPLVTAPPPVAQADADKTPAQLIEERDHWRREYEEAGIVASSRIRYELQWRTAWATLRGSERVLAAWLAEHAPEFAGEKDSPAAASVRLFARLEAVVGRLQKADPVFDGECVLCGKVDLNRRTDGPEKHPADCPWRIAKELPPFRVE